MNTRCGHCKAKGYVQKDGKHVGNNQPYTLVCPICNGVGHYRGGPSEQVFAEGVGR